MISVRRLLHPSKSREKVWQALGPFLRLARARPIIGCMPQHGNFLTGLGKLEGARGPPSSPKAVTGKSPPDGGRAVSLHESRLIWHQRGFISRRGSAWQLSSLPVRRRGGEKLKEWVMERYSHVAPEISLATTQKKVEKVCDF